MPELHIPNSWDKNDRPAVKKVISSVDTHEQILGKFDSTLRTYLGLGKSRVEELLDSQKGIREFFIYNLVGFDNHFLSGNNNNVGCRNHLMFHLPKYFTNSSFDPVSCYSITNFF